MIRIAPLVGLLALWTAQPAIAQSISIDLGSDGDTLAGRGIQLFLLITVLSLAPGIAMMITCFPFLITVLSILRQGIGLQQSPPNILLITLALFLTYYVMEPVFAEAWRNGVSPFVDGETTAEEAFPETMDPFRGFMLNRIDPGTFEALAVLRPDTAEVSLERGSPLSLMVPSFLLSEIERAFRIGFVIFLPFLIIDLVVAAILMSMGMMMVPPAIVALPFKLAFFAVADGWTLVSSALVRGYF